MYIIDMGRKKIKVVAGIYRITCLITGSVYVGSSKDLYKRLRQYKEPKCNISKDIKESIITHGIENHEIKILCEFDSDIPVKELHTYEDAFILLYLSRLGEELILNSKCNDSSKWVSERLKLSLKKNGSHGIFGKDHKSSKKVNQYTKYDKFIKTWDCMSDINRELGINISNISECCIGKGRYKTVGGFKWKFKDA